MYFDGIYLQKGSIRVRAQTWALLLLGRNVGLGHGLCMALMSLPCFIYSKDYQTIEIPSLVASSIQGGGALT